MEIVIQIVIIMIFLEIFELYIQKADTLRDMIDNLYSYSVSYTHLTLPTKA